jgi:hypothetical protein
MLLIFIELCFSRPLKDNIHMFVIKTTSGCTSQGSRDTKFTGLYWFLVKLTIILFLTESFFLLFEIMRKGHVISGHIQAYRVL